MVVMYACGVKCVLVDVCVVAGHRADDFFCRFWEPHRAGEVLPNFFLEMTVFSYFAEKSESGVAPCRAGLPAQRRLTTAPPP